MSGVGTIARAPCQCGLQTYCCIGRKAFNLPLSTYPSSFKLQMRWLHLLTPVTYLSKLPEMRKFAAFLQLELFRV